jgi:hypothetical protein
MARKPDPARIYAARRAAVGSNLTGAGMAPEDAERWLLTWEDHAAQNGVDRTDREFWQIGEEWITQERRRR